MRYTPDHRGTGRYLNESPALRDELHRRALLGQSAAIVALEPRRRTGRLAASSEVSDDGPLQGVHHDRMQHSINFEVSYAVPATFRARWLRAYLEVAIAAMEAGR